MDYAAATIWFERQRYLPAVLAVTFSGLMAAMPTAILLGLVSSMTLPIERSDADLWITHPRTISVELGRTIPTEWSAHLWSDPGVSGVEPIVLSMGHWTTPGGRSELVVIVGCSLESDSAGLASVLTPVQRRLLNQEGGVFINKQDGDRLGIQNIGSIAQVNKRSVRILDWVTGMPSLAGPYVICSVATARTLMRLREDQTTYLIVRCHDPGQIDAVHDRLNRLRNAYVISAEDFASRSQAHWILATNVGAALAFMSFMGMAVGISIVGQSLYSAMIASETQFAVLRALGTPRRRIARFAGQVGILVALAGMAMALPLMFLLCFVARWAGTNATLPMWLIAVSILQTLVTSLVATLIALRSIRRTDPAILLH